MIQQGRITLHERTLLIVGGDTEGQTFPACP
jgi:hypothetical protein